MFPGCGKYLAFQSCERATEERNSSRHSAVETEQIPEPDVRGAVWTVVCECVCAAHQNVCVRRGQHSTWRFTLNISISTQSLSCVKNTPVLLLKLTEVC